MIVGLFASFAKADNSNPTISQPAADIHQRVVRLIEKLQDENSSTTRFKEEWCHTLKQGIELGPEAVPDLIRELDATNDEMMLRCLGFILRAIGDARAVPALIRAVPRTLVRTGSDMGLTTEDPEVFKFLKQNSLSPSTNATYFDFGRPVREIFGAIGSITGQAFDEYEIFHVRVDGSENQLRRKEVAFHRKAEEVAEWWRKNWRDYVEDEVYAKVGLPELIDRDTVDTTPLDTPMMTVPMATNVILASVHDAGARRVFHDFDTGRMANLPKKWRGIPLADDLNEEIIRWAILNGFDLMGTETMSPEGNRIFVIRALAMQTWELDGTYWKRRFKEPISFQQLISEGRSIEGLLLHYDADKKESVPTSPGTFAFVTRHGTFGLLFVGVQVQDDSKMPAGPKDVDLELQDVGYTKGRRFGFSLLEPAKNRR